MKALGLATATALLALLAAGPATAKDGDIRAAGTCTRGSTSKIKLSEENGRIEVELEVDQNRNGVRWVVAIVQNRTRVVRMSRVTRPPSGSFEARIVAPNRPGADRFTGRATSPTGEVCVARATWPS